DRAFELPSQRRELLRQLAANKHWRRHDLTRGCGGPGVRISDQWQIAWLDHFQRDLLERPASSQRPRFQLRALAGIRGEPIAYPFRRALVCRRSRQPGTDVDGQVLEHGRDLGPLESLASDLRENWIAALRTAEGDDHNGENEGRKDSAHQCLPQRLEVLRLHSTLVEGSSYSPVSPAPRTHSSVSGGTLCALILSGVCGV